MSTTIANGQEATTAGAYHIPVLLHESIDQLVANPDGTYIDVTFGGGGHSREILSRLSPKGKLYGFDQDADAEGNIVDDERFTFVRSNFRYLKNWVRYYHIQRIDGILADLGVSSHHLDDSSRGFSFRFDSPLDMRMNKRQSRTAEHIVNDYDEQQLASVLYLYGELKSSRRVAAAIAGARAKGRISTTGELIAAITPTLPHEREKKDMAKVFQALRIEVNHEMTALREMLLAATDVLGAGGRLAVITYHSLEDRMVKNIIRTGNPEGHVAKDFFGKTQCPLRAVNNRVIVPTTEEQRNNPRSRSAKLRIAEKI